MNPFKWLAYRLIAWAYPASAEAVSADDRTITFAVTVKSKFHWLPLPPRELIEASLSPSPHVVAATIEQSRPKGKGVFVGHQPEGDAV